MTSVFTLPLALSILFLVSTAEAQGQYHNTRCKCICPDPNVVLNVTESNSTNRTLYISNTVPGNLCNCQTVVLPELEKKGGVKGKEGEFCPRCHCVFENRNMTTIEVVVIIVIWVVSLLMIYMLFLMCLDPLLNKRLKNTAYQEHTNDDDESAAGGRTSHPMRVTSGGGSFSSTTTITATSLGPSASVLNRVGHSQQQMETSSARTAQEYL